MKTIVLAAAGTVGGVLVLAVILYVWLERSVFPKPSTRVFWNLSPMPLKKRLEGYFYGVRPDLYLKPATWDWVQRHFDQDQTGDSYHGKVVTREHAGKIIALNRPIEIPDLEHIVPYATARSIILREPMPVIAAMDCPCRAQKADACEPRDVCLVVGEPFVSFVLEHHPKKSRRLSVDEALAMLEAEEQRGHIHTAWFKDVMHDRFYTICNCCPCCCLGMASYQRGTARIAHSGYRPVFQRESCSACGICTEICPFHAITIHEDAYAMVDLDCCMGCGLCVSHCAVEGITLELAPEKGIPLDVDALDS
ncbi:MAG: 4Fe-4S binding protein [Solirubrobacterales bacterium]